ncbi:MAG: M48 family metallopeptidase [Salinibacter sp.]
MNVYGAIVLAALLAEYGLNAVADVLNLRTLQSALPDEFADTFDADTYAESQDYTRARTRFGLLQSSVGVVVLLAFWFAGGFAWLDGLVRGWELHPILTGLCYIGLLIGAQGVLSLPFSLYGTFVIEERFGFNETTLRTFVLDRLKGLALGLAIGGPLLAALLWFFQQTGPFAWIYAWGTVTVVMLLLQYVAPRFLMPLFNDFEPLEDGELRHAILDYADSVDFALDDIYVMDGSRRSSKSNAFFTGFGANRRIVLFDTLVEEQSVDELVTIVAHEMGHYKRHHIPQRMAISVLQTGVLFLLLSVFLQVEGLYAAFYVEQLSVYTGLVFFGLLYTPVDLFLSLPLQAWSRRHEYEADAFAVETTGRPGTFASALKQLAASNRAHLTPHPLYVALHHSHPPLRERIRHVREQATVPAQG